MKLSKKNVVYGQDKDTEGKLPKRTMEGIGTKFKRTYNDYQYDTRNIGGFEVNGGDGMTKGALSLWDEFVKWCESRDMIAIYNTNGDVENIKLNLRNRVENKVINENKF